MEQRHARVWHRSKPSADKLGNAYHRHGPLIGMEPPRRSIWSRVLGRG